MIYYRGGKWFISTEKIIYKQDGATLESIIGQEGKQWWKDLSKKWKKTEIIEFVPLDDITPLSLSRLEKINAHNISEVYFEEVEAYVLEGRFPQGSGHSLRAIEMEEKNLKLEEKIIQKEFEDSLLEINTYLLLKNLIKEGRYGEEDEIISKINVFFISDKISEEESLDLKSLVQEKVKEFESLGVKPTDSMLVDLTQQQIEIKAIKSLLADLSELILLGVE